jgi:arylsulfatase A-like enzyme
VHVVDLFTTTLELAGLKAPTMVANSDGTAQEKVDGVSLAPLLFKRATTVRDPNQGYLLAETVNLMTNGTREAAARNARYKVVCRTPDNCEFYDLVDDPLEEYPLARPASCSAFAAGTWTPANREWHYCRLTDVVATQTFMKTTGK